MVEISSSQYNEDDRAQRLLNVFDLESGQINVSYVNSTKHVVAWHVHKIQTDYWACLRGSFKVGLAIPKEDGSHRVKWEYLSDKSPKTLRIPPGVYHGYKALEPGSIMLYFLTEKYNPDDEIRAQVGDFGEEWETENK
jgi:dTDP-4-dehydrorhamnose 3,5-epimerase-like enzyme